MSRFLLVSHAYPPDAGAASARTWNIAKSLTKHGHEVDILAARPYYPLGIVPPRYWNRFAVRERRDGIETVRVWVPALPTEGLWRRLVIYLSFELSYGLAMLLFFSRRHDLIYYISPYGLSFFSFFACLLGRMKGSRVALDVHDAWPDVVLEVGTIRSPLARRVLVFMARVEAALADFVSFAADSMSGNLELPRGRKRVLPLSVDTDLFRPLPANPLRQNDFHGKFVAMCSGTLARRYDFQTLLDAAGLLKEEKDILFVIRGNGEMERTIRRSIRSPNVALLTETLPPERVVGYLDSADIFLCLLLPSQESERSSIPYRLIEYLAMGKPVLASDSGNIGTAIRESGGGMVVSPSDAEALARQVLKARDGGAMGLARFGENARSYAERNFSLDSSARIIEEMLA